MDKNMMTIEEKKKYLKMLGQHYKTDKVEHGYLPYYAEYLPDNVRSMLEIGVLKGASAKMWDEYFNKNVDIHLIDLFEEPGNLTEREARRLEFVPHKGDQTDLILLRALARERKFDFITEDASHNSGDQIETFKFCFWDLIKSGGLYVVEDTHCCFEPFYWNGRVKKYEDTILSMFEEYKKTGKIDNVYFTPAEGVLFEQMIGRVEIHKGIIFIWKR